MKLNKDIFITLCINSGVALESLKQKGKKPYKPSDQ